MKLEKRAFITIVDNMVSSVETCDIDELMKYLGNAYVLDINRLDNTVFYTITHDVTKARAHYTFA